MKRCRLSTLDHGKVLSHYSPGRLLDQIVGGLVRRGITPDTATATDLEPFDEFHVGGKTSAMNLFKKLSIRRGDTILDIGCGLGGPARLAARLYPGCHVRGIDVSTEYVEVGNILSSWPGVGLRRDVELSVGSALDMKALPSSSISHSYMIHVGMNISDKAALGREVCRVLKPGGGFAVFDIMSAETAGASPRAADSVLSLRYPLPWASDAGGGEVAPREEYERAMCEAGLGYPVAHTDNTEMAVKAVRASLHAISEGGDDAPLAAVMGGKVREKTENLLAMLEGGLLVAIEMIWHKSSSNYHQQPPL